MGSSRKHGVPLGCHRLGFALTVTVYTLFGPSCHKLRAKLNKEYMYHTGFLAVGIQFADIVAAPRS